MGAWSAEPEDLVLWKSERTAWQWCSLVRNPVGCWGGYCQVDSGHPLVGKLAAPIRWHISVYNGITYSSDVPPHPVLQTPEPRWWVGFETGNFLDVVPANPSLHNRPRQYRTLTWCTNETERLALRLHQILQRARIARNKIA